MKRPLCSSLSQSSSCTTAPLIKSSPGSQEEVHPSGSSCSSGAPYLSIPHHHHHHLYQHAAANGYTGDATYANYASPLTETGDGYVDAPSGSRSHVDFKSYVARIIWEADNDGEALPPDAYHVWCVEGSGSSAGSLSSLGSAASRRNIVVGPGDEEEEEDEDEGEFVYDRLSRWGPKFEALSEMYDRPQLSLTYRDAVAYIQRSHETPPHHH